MVELEEEIDKLEFRLELGRGIYGEILDSLNKVNRGLKAKGIANHLKQKKVFDGGKAEIAKKLGPYLRKLEKEGLIERPWPKRFRITVHGQNRRAMVIQTKKYEKAQKLKEKTDELFPRAKEKVERLELEKQDK